MNAHYTPKHSFLCNPDADVSTTKDFFRDDSVQPYFVDFVKPCCWVTSQHVCVMYCQKPLVQTNLLYLMKLYGHC